jgi:hypothetical protein
MRFVFLDESGFAKTGKGINEQPFYVLAVFTVDAHRYINACENLRIQFSEIIPSGKPLGQGYEIKAKDICNGGGKWKDNAKRAKVRDCMLSFPEKTGGKVFLCVIDKKKQNMRYRTPYADYRLALQFGLERVQKYLSITNDFAICIFDQAKHIDDEVHGLTTDLFREGSYVPGSSTIVKLSNIKEFYLGRSENSVGIQVADFFATFTYQFFKKGMRETHDWWITIRNQLYASEEGNNKIIGKGLKIFPQLSSREKNLLLDSWSDNFRCSTVARSLLI